jgi:DNA-directed RNA polymerase subunit F
MAEIHIVKETPLNMAEMRHRLEEIKKRDKELNFRAKKTEEYLNLASKIKLQKADELKKELQKLEIERLKPTLITKIIDILPKDLDSLRSIFSNEALSLKEDDIVKILDVVKKYA